MTMIDEHNYSIFIGNVDIIGIVINMYNFTFSTNFDSLFYIELYTEQCILSTSVEIPDTIIK